MKKFRNLFLIILAFFAGSFATLATGLVFAHGGDTSLIHGCVRNNGLLAGFVRIVSANTNCANNETALDWTKEAGNNGLPFMCPGCVFNSSTSPLGNRFKNKNLSNSYLTDAKFYGVDISGSKFANGSVNNTLFDSSNLDNTDFTGLNVDGLQVILSSLTNSIFKNTHGGPALNGSTGNNIDFTNVNYNGAPFNSVNFVNPNFSNSTLTGTEFTSATIQSGNFTNADLRHSNFSNANMTSSNFTNVNFSLTGNNNNPTSFLGTNLTNVNFTGANLQGAVDMNTATITGVIWSNTTCPDGTNSNSHGNTCVGHLTP